MIDINVNSSSSCFPPGGSRASNSLQRNQTLISPSRSVSGASAGPSTASVQPQPYLYPKATEFKSGEPVFGEVRHGDTKFMGKLRYVPQKNVSEGKDEGEKEQKATGEGWLE